MFIKKGELTTEYYKTPECANNLYKINSITKSIVSILIGIAIGKGYINDIHTPITKWILNVPKRKKRINNLPSINDDNRRRLEGVLGMGSFSQMILLNQRTGCSTY